MLTYVNVEIKTTLRKIYWYIIVVAVSVSEYKILGENESGITYVKIDCKGDKIAYTFIQNI